MKQILLSAGILLAMGLSVSAQQNEIFVKDKAAIGGYDVVAYFKEGKPVKGNGNFPVSYKGAIWLFSNKANADAFKAMPDKYEPQYGGYCAYGCSQGHKAKTEPDAWTIVDGKLYLNYNTDVKAKWSKDRPGYIKKADENWPKVKAEKF